MKGSIFVLSAIILFSCGEDDLVNPDLTLPNESSNINVISTPTLEVDQDFTDEFTILSATPYEDRFEIVVEYGGGCGEHEFELIWDQSIAESFPMQTGMVLSHNSNKDICLALLRDTLSISYASIEGFSMQDMIVHLDNGSNDQVVTIDSRIIPLMTEDCELEVILERALCGRGPWGDLWFKLPTGIGAWEQVWLQPVSIPEELKLMNPAEGSTAKIRVRGLFGHQYPFPEGEVVCLALPGGLIMPVEVLCIE